MLLLMALLACPKAPVANEVPANGPPAMRPVYVLDPAVEERVAARMAELAAVYDAGRYDDALATIDRTLAEEPENSWSGTLRAWRAELAFIHRPAPELVVLEWIQGDAPPVQGTTLFVFFEAWCPHCQQEMPALSAIATQFEPSGLHVVGLTQQSRGVTSDDVRALLGGAGASFAVAREDGTLSAAYGVVGIPSYALVKDGIVIFRGHPSLLSPEALARLLAPSPSPAAP